MDQLETERIEMQIWAQELYLKDNIEPTQPKEFRRKQSALFNKLNPDLVCYMVIESVHGTIMVPAYRQIIQ